MKTPMQKWNGKNIVCKDFNEKTINENKYYAPPNCFFRFKAEKQYAGKTT